MTVQAVYAEGKLFDVRGIGYEPRGEFLLDNKVINIEDYPELQSCLQIGVLCNGAELVKENEAYKIIGTRLKGRFLSVRQRQGCGKMTSRGAIRLSKRYPLIRNARK